MENGSLESRIKSMFELNVKRDYFFIKEGLKTLNIEDNENKGVYTLSLVNNEWNFKYSLPKEGSIDFGNYEKSKVCILKTKLKGISERFGETYHFILNDPNGETSSYELRKEFCEPVLGETKGINNSYFFNENSPSVILELDNGFCKIKNKVITNHSGRTFYKTTVQLKYNNCSIEFDCEAAIIDHKGNDEFCLNFMDEYGDKMILKNKKTRFSDFSIKDVIKL